MKQVVFEFSRPLQVSRISKGGSHEVIKADAEECARLAKRLDVPALHALSAVNWPDRRTPPPRQGLANSRADRA